MDDRFYYIGDEILNIQNNKMLCIYILDITKHCIFKIYKKNIELQEQLTNINYFDEVTSFIRFVIKRDGKCSLDIIL